jgi:hypothetical protein
VSLLSLFLQPLAIISRHLDSTHVHAQSAKNLLNMYTPIPNLCHCCTAHSIAHSTSHTSRTFQAIAYTNMSTASLVIVIPQSLTPGFCDVIKSNSVKVKKQSWSIQRVGPRL